MAIFGRRRIKRPVEGHAEIVDAWIPNRGAAVGNCRMKLLLDVPGVPKQIVDYHELAMTENRWPRAGMRVAVTVDADHPDRVKVDWDSVFGPVMGGPLGRVAELAAGAINVDLDLSRGPEGTRGGPDPNQDTEALVKALNERFAAGEITYEEMSAELMKVLGVEPPA